MRTTVETGVWGKGRKNSDKELELQLSQVRTALNKVYQLRKTVVSVGGGGPQTLWIDPDELIQDVHATLTVVALASNADGTAYGKFEHTAMFLRPPIGPAVQLGAEQLRHPDIATAGVSIALGVTASSLFISGNDGGTALTWDLWIEARSA
jgi:hypothetical protein